VNTEETKPETTQEVNETTNPETEQPTNEVAINNLEPVEGDNIADANPETEQPADEVAHNHVEPVAGDINADASPEPNKEAAHNHVEPVAGDIIADANNDNPEQYQAKLAAIESEARVACKAAAESPDYRASKQRLADIKDKMKGLFLKNEDNSRVIGIIDETIMMIDERAVQERRQTEQISTEQYTALKNQIAEAREKTTSMTIFNEAREVIINLQKEIRKAKLLKNHRDELFDSIGKIFEDINKKQVESRLNFEMECSENYLVLKKIIDEAAVFAKATQSYAKAREALIKSQEKIKGKTLKRDQREELYQIIRAAFDELRSRESDDRELFEKEVDVNYTHLKKIVEDACEFSSNSNDFKAAREALINAQSSIKGLKLKRDQRDEFYQKIRAVFEDLNSRQSEDREEFEEEAIKNYQTLTEKVNEAFALVHGLDNFNMIRDNLIAVQAEIKILRLRRKDRNELFARIREAFSIFDEKRNKYYDERKAEKLGKLNNQLAALNSRLANLNEVIAKDKAALEGELPEENKKKIENKISSTEGNIKDVQTKIESTNKEIEKVKVAKR
jgi:hypothetical protein